MPKYKVYDLPQKTPIAEGLTDKEAQRFEQLGFYIEPMGAANRKRGQLQREAEKIRKRQLQGAARRAVKKIKVKT